MISLKKSFNIRRGDIYYADLSPVYGSEQGGIRPVLVIQNDMGNEKSDTIIIAAISSKIKKTTLPTHVYVHGNKFLPKNSAILLEQIRTIDKDRLQSYKTRLNDDVMKAVDNAILNSLGISIF